MADFQNESTAANHFARHQATSAQRKEYLGRILHELNVLFSVAISGDYTAMAGVDLIVPPTQLQRLRSLLESVRQDFVSAFVHEGHKQNMVACSPCQVTGFIDFHFPADMLNHIRNIRDSESAYGRVAGFCVPSVCQVFYEKARPWAAMATTYLRNCWSTTRAFIVSTLLLLAPQKTTAVIMDVIVDPLLSIRFLECEQRLKAVLTPSPAGLPLLSTAAVVGSIHETRLMFSMNETKTRLQKYVTTSGPLMNNGYQASVASSGEINTRIVPDHLADYLTTRTEAETDNRACAEMLCCVQGLWQRASVKLERSVTLQCIEFDLLARLKDAFSTDLVSYLDTTVFRRVAVETVDARSKRPRPKKSDNVIRGVQQESHQGEPSPTPTRNSSMSNQRIIPNAAQATTQSGTALEEPASTTKSLTNEVARSSHPNLKVSLSVIKSPMIPPEPRSSSSSPGTVPANSPTSSPPAIPSSAIRPSQSLNPFSCAAFTARKKRILAARQLYPNPIPSEHEMSRMRRMRREQRDKSGPANPSPSEREMGRMRRMRREQRDKSGPANRTPSIHEMAIQKRQSKRIKTQQNSFSNTRNLSLMSMSLQMPSTDANERSPPHPCQPAPLITLTPAFPCSTSTSTPPPQLQALIANDNSTSWHTCSGTLTSTHIGHLVVPTQERTGAHPNGFESCYYQSIYTDVAFRGFSPEECRVADYEAGRRYSS
ncbi:MAG: hypothetical protein LQ348_006147 [Seirophora lacunosa]|nr:MAG: hypothetical protein LQ348_006147 [Seirophora lacunosa]